MSLLEVDGRLSFVVDPTPIGPVDPRVAQQVKIAPIDLAALAMRPDSASGCRFVRDRYAALLASASGCLVDSDCTVLNHGEGAGLDACNLYLPVSVATEAGKLMDQFRDACLWSPYCAPSQPIACHQGRCDAVCPGIYVPPCPPDCQSIAQATPGAKCMLPTSGTCLDDRGDFCSCVGNVVQCATPAHISEACSLRCDPRSRPTSSPSGVAGRAP